MTKENNQEQSKEKDSPQVPEETVKRELSLLMGIHACFALFAAAMAIYALVSPGNFTFSVELTAGLPPGQGKLPEFCIPGLTAYLFVLALFNAASTFALLKRKLLFLPLLTAFVNCFSLIGIPISLTTVFTLLKPAVKQKFS